MRYKVLRDCHFMNRYWNAGEIASFPEPIDNEHFEAFDGNVPDERIIEVLPEVSTMSAINAQRKDSQPKTGMGYTPPVEEKEEKPTGKGKPGPKPRGK